MPKRISELPAAAALNPTDEVEINQGGVSKRAAMSLVLPARKNFLINGAFSVNQEAPASSADDTYAHDQWYALTQTGAIAASTLTDVEDGLPRMARLTQSQAAAQRMGYAQIIEGKNCKHLRGKTVTFRFGRVRISASQAIRYAILEWTGTEDAVVSDVVNDWTSADYTDGAAKFFVDANIIPVGNTSHTPAAATLTDGPSLTATLGSTFNNLIVLAWTQGTAAQNVTLDLGKAQLELGSVATEFERRDYQDELALCQRYWTKSYNPGVAIGTITTVNCMAFVTANAGNGEHSNQYFPVEMRATPTLTYYSTQTGLAGKVYNATTAADVNAVGSSTLGARNYAGFGVGVAAGSLFLWHHTASARL